MNDEIETQKPNRYAGRAAFDLDDEDIECELIGDEPTPSPPKKPFATEATGAVGDATGNQVGGEKPSATENTSDANGEIECELIGIQKTDNFVGIVTVAKKGGSPERITEERRKNALELAHLTPEPTETTLAPSRFARLNNFAKKGRWDLINKLIDADRVKLVMVEAFRTLLGTLTPKQKLNLRAPDSYNNIIGTSFAEVPKDEETPRSSGFRERDDEEEPESGSRGQSEEPRVLTFAKCMPTLNQSTDSPSYADGDEKNGAIRSGKAMITASGPDEDGAPTVIRVSDPRDPDDPEGYLTESYWLHRLHLALMRDEEGDYYAYYRDRAIEEHEGKDDTL